MIQEVGLTDLFVALEITSPRGPTSLTMPMTSAFVQSPEQTYPLGVRTTSCIFLEGFQRGQLDKVVLDHR
jgi:hypothetical protein